MEREFNHLPRGYRNNNPLNIVRNNIKWKGMSNAQTDARFCVFKEMKYGFRAAIIILCRSYYIRKWWTIRQIISHWAPSNENNTEAYIEKVCVYTGISADSILPQPNKKNRRVLIRLITAMAIVENGYWDEDYKGDLILGMSMVFDPDSL